MTRFINNHQSGKAEPQSWRLSLSDSCQNTAEQGCERPTEGKTNQKRRKRIINSHLQYEQCTESSMFGLLMT